MPLDKHVQEKNGPFGRDKCVRLKCFHILCGTFSQFSLCSCVVGDKLKIGQPTERQPTNYITFGAGLNWLGNFT